MVDHFKMLFVVLLGIFGSTQADYDCFCNYEIELKVLSAMDDSASALGYMYEFDCKEQLNDVITNAHWLAIAFEHKVGYVREGGQMDSQICQGEPATDDKVPSTELRPPVTTAPTTTTTTPKPTTTTTTPKPTTKTTTTTTTAKPTTTTTTPKPTTTTTTHKPTTTPKPTTTTPKPTTTTTTPKPTTTTTPKPTTTTTTPKPTTTTTPKLTTTTTTTPKPTTTTSTTPKPTTTSTTSKPTTTTHKPTTPATTSPVPTPWQHTIHTVVVLTGGFTTAPTTSTTTGQPHECPSHIQNHIQTGVSAAFVKNGNKCYEFVDILRYWPSAEHWCSQFGGHLVQIGSQQEQDFLTHYMLHNYFRHPVWIGLHDRNHEEVFQWTSGDPVTFTNWTPGRKVSFTHKYEDCVYMDPRGGHHLGGEWDDVDCTDNGMDLMGDQRRFVCQYDLTASSALPPTTQPIVSTQLSVGNGNINMCPNRILHGAQHRNLGQYGHYCYELIPTKSTWRQSENMCKQFGGHLVSIANAGEQQYVSSFVQRHSPQHAVWLGLNDVNTEGAFHWSSGQPVQYTNWLPSHQNNFASHHEEDCVTMVPYMNNVWDDVPCAYHGQFDDVGTNHYPLCQYRIGSNILIG